MIPLSSILLCDIRLKPLDDTICAADLTRLSDLPNLDWSFRNRRPDKPSDSHVGKEVAQFFIGESTGLKALFVGECMSVEVEGELSFFNVQCPVGDGEEFDDKAFAKARKRFLASAHRHTAAEVKPSASPLYAKRKQRALRCRPAATTTAQRAAALKHRLFKQTVARAARLRRRHRP